jgi:hypothetical protein
VRIAKRLIGRKRRCEVNEIIASLLPSFSARLVDVHLTCTPNPQLQLINTPGRNFPNYQKRQPRLNKAAWLRWTISWSDHTC